MANKTMKVTLPEDSPAWHDLLAYGREMGMQPAETARVVLAEWSRALRGHTPFGGVLAITPPAPAVEAVKPKNEQAKTKARVTRLAGADLDDDE